MDYDAVKAIFFVPPPADVRPAMMQAPSAPRRLRDAIEAVGMHAVWSRSVHELLATHGLDFFGGYVWGRVTSLGEPTGAVVAATFASFEPSMIAGIYDAAHRAVPHDVLLADLERSVGRSLRAVLEPAGAGEAEVVAVTDALYAAVDAADGTGKALFSGVRGLGRPADPYAALWRGCLALREFRGDAHVAVYVAAGLDPVRMNILTELWAGYRLGDYSTGRAWSAEATQAALTQLRTDGWLDGEELTDVGATVLAGLEATTDRLCAPLVAAMGDAFDAAVTTLTGWGEACIAAEAFPPDPRKLACG